MRGFYNSNSKFRRVSLLDVAFIDTAETAAIKSVLKEMYDQTKNNG